MAPHAPWNTSDISDKARKDLLLLLEGVSKDHHALLPVRPGVDPTDG
jgi:hypothetical protein